jgi:aspartate carbamoyltransferase catalytic subunit
MILHPLPRTVELDKTVDSDPRAFYFKQAANGLCVRMALLTMLLDR